MISLFARALAGGDVVSFNLYRLRSGEDSLRPCEMPAEKVVAFVLGYGLTAFEPLRIQSDFTISSLLRRLSSSLEVVRCELPDGRRFGG
jgi:hypothetical protein